MFQLLQRSLDSFLTLNTLDNIIPGSGTAVRSNIVGTGEVDVSSGVILINLNPGNLIQIVPVEVIGSVDVRRRRINCGTNWLIKKAAFEKIFRKPLFLFTLSRYFRAVRLPPQDSERSKEDRWE